VKDSGNQQNKAARRGKQPAKPIEQYSGAGCQNRLLWPKHVVKDSGNQQNKAAHRGKHNLQNPLNNTVQQDAKI
jgi:hypothetical protein